MSTDDPMTLTDPWSLSGTSELVDGLLVEFDDADEEGRLALLGELLKMPHFRSTLHQACYGQSRLLRRRGYTVTGWEIFSEFISQILRRGFAAEVERLRERHPTRPGLRTTITWRVRRVGQDLVKEQAKSAARSKPLEAASDVPAKAMMNQDDVLRARAMELVIGLWEFYVGLQREHETRAVKRSASPERLKKLRDDNAMQEAYLNAMRDVYGRGEAMEIATLQSELNRGTRPAAPELEDGTFRKRMVRLRLQTLDWIWTEGRRWQEISEGGGEEPGNATPREVWEKLFELIPALRKLAEDERNSDA